jgi:leader peptidase (prepilin peptidase)/N-methyltransferase
VEILTAVVFVVLFMRFDLVGFVFQALFFSTLIVIFFIDLDHQIIPNRLVLVLLGLTVVGFFVNPQVTVVQALLGGLLGGGLFLLLAVVSGGGMGGGDIKLTAVFGLWFGWGPLLLLMFLSFLGGGLVSGVLLALGIKKRKDGIPFGPFLVLAAFVVGIWGEQMIQWYLRLSGL